VGKGGTVVVVAGIITLGACAGSHRASAPIALPTSTTSHSAPPSVPPPAGRPRSTTTAPVATTAPRPVSEYSFDGSVAPPELVNTGTDYVAILKSLESYGDWLGAHHPDPALALTTVAPGTPLLDRYLHDIVNLRNAHARLVEKLNGPTTYTLLSVTPNAFSARVVEHIATHRTVDRAGHVTSERRYTGTTTYIDVVVLAGGHWYFAAVDLEHPAEVHL
jgi:hypothetical protein